MTGDRRLPTTDAVSSTPEAYASLFLASHAIVLLVDPATGAIVDANPAASAFYGYDHDTLTSMGMSAINLRPHEEVGPEIAAAVAAGPSVFEFEHRLASGEVRQVEVTTGRVTLDSRELLYSIVHDATPRVLAERRAERLQRLYEALVEIGRALGSLDEPDALYREACRLAVEVAGFRSAFVALRVPKDPQDLRIVAAAGTIAPLVHGLHEISGTDLAREGALHAALARGQTTVVDDVLAGELASGFWLVAGSLGLRSAVVVPLRASAGVGGAVVVLRAGCGEFDAREIGLLERMASDLASRVESIERERAREAADARFRVMFEQTRVPIAINRGEANLYVNDAFLELLGFASREEVEGRPVLYFVEGEDRAAVRHRLRLRATGDEPAVPYETVIEARNGTRIPVRIHPTPIQLPDGPATAVFIENLTASRLAEAALRDSEARYRMLLEQASDAILICGQDDRLIEANQSACLLLGYSREQLVGLSPRDLVQPKTRGSQAANLATLHGGHSIIRERTFVRRDGSLVDVELSARRLPDGRLLAIVRDITERKAAQAERDRLGAAVEQATESVVMAGPDGRIIYVNPAFTAITGFAASEVLGRAPNEVLRYEGQSPELYEAMDAASAGGPTFTGHVVDRRRDGSPVELDLVISPLRDSSGAIVGSVELGRDVSRERALEEQLRQSQKMEAVGRLAGGIAHDFNNLMTAICGYGELLASTAGPDSPMASDIAEIRRAADRAASLTRQLLAFARKTVLQPRVLDLDEVVAGMVPMLERLIGEDVDLVVRVHPGLGRTLADAGHVEQLIMNLAVNARDAMPSGGTFTLETMNAELDDAYSATHSGVQPGRYVALVVSDTGVGMSRDVLEHIFEPFFTTKELGKGTGLGLSTVFGVVKQSNGHVTAYSEPGLGSTFRIYLPRVDDPVSDEAVPGRQSQPCSRDGGETILLVEDEEAVRRFAGRVLERHGYRVLPAPSGHGALAVLAAQPGPIDLLFTDIVMPGLSGPDLAAEVIAIRPGTPVLYTSGYSAEATSRFGAGEVAANYLGKPYAADALLAGVRNAIDAGPQSLPSRTSGAT